MKFCNRKDLMLLTTVLCGVASLGANAAKANFVPTLGDKAAYKVTTDGATKDKHDFVYVTLDENNVPQYQYYNWSLNTDNIAKNSISITQVFNPASESDYDFKVAHGTDADGNPVHDYFKYSILTNPETVQIVKDLKVESDTESVYGGANSAIAGSDNISAIFINNHVSSSAYGTSSNPIISGGGAIANTNNSTIASISGNFINNFANNSGSGNYNDARGGAVFNEGYNGTATIGDITSDFVGNYASSSGFYAYGGAVYNGGPNATIGDITGDFVGNYASSSNYVYGGAVYNNSLSYHGSTIGNITGDFVGNYASGSYVYGGAVFNDGTIGRINEETEEMTGGISGDFIGNYASSSASYAWGGAVYNGNNGTINLISGDFVGNYAKASGEYVQGGAVYNLGTITFVADAENPDYEDDIKFQGNYISVNGKKDYEAIYNPVSTPCGPGCGVVLRGKINFEAKNGASYTFYDYINGSDSQYSISGGIINFTSEDNSGVLNLYNHIKEQGAVNFNASYTINTTDGEIKQIEIRNLNMNAKSLLNLDVDLAGEEGKRIDSFKLTGTNTGAENLSLSGLKLLNDMNNGTDTLTLTYADKDFTAANYITRYISTSKWIYAYTNDATGLIISKEDKIGGYVNFLIDAYDLGAERSYDFTEDETIKHDGLVIGDMANLTINGNGHNLIGEDKDGTSALKLAEGQKASMSDLTISGFETGIDTAGELALNGVTIKDSTTGLKLGANVALSGTNTFEGNTTDIEVAEGEYTLKLAEDSVLNLNALTTGTNAKLSLIGSDESYINMGESASVSGLDLILDGPTLKLADESTNLANVNSFEARSGTLDLQNDVVRALVAQDFSVTGAINLLVDADLANKTMDTLGEVTVADTGSINVSGIKILSDGAEDLTQIDFAGEEYKDKVSTSVKQVLSTQYTYRVVYNAETGQFEFVRSQMLQPEDVAVNRGSTIANAGAVMLTEAVSQRALGADVVNTQGASSGDEFGLKAWVQTFGSRDDVELKHLSPAIDAKFYAVLGGIDSKTFAYDNGVKATYGVYGAYTRSEQKYSGNKIKQKGGYFGLKALFEKGGLFSKLTANMGFLNNEALTEWGKDKFDTKVVSAATQTGYDFKLKPSKVPFNLRGEKPFYEMNTDITITPSLYVGYMGIDTDDYTSKAGTAIKNKFMNVVEIAPELKVANNFGNGFEGYLKGAYKMFIYDNDQVRVDTALLPSMSVKPYVEYGFGFEKTFSSAKAYGDIMRHDGGKRGWDFNLGIKLEF